MKYILHKNIIINGCGGILDITTLIYIPITVRIENVRAEVSVISRMHIPTSLIVFLRIQSFLVR